MRISLKFKDENQFDESFEKNRFLFLIKQNKHLIIILSFIL